MSGDVSDAWPDHPAGVVGPGTAKALLSEVEGHNRLLGRGDFKPPTAEYTFYRILLPLGSGFFAFVYNIILLHIDRRCGRSAWFRHYSIINWTSSRTNGSWLRMKLI